MRAIAFDLTISRAAAKARSVVLDRALAEAKSTEHAMVVLVRIGMEL